MIRYLISSMGTVIGVILIFVFVIALALYGMHQTKKRREALSALAVQFGWQFDPNGDFSHESQFAHFEIFRRGDSRTAYNTLTGTIPIDGQPCPAKMGDFSYKVTSGSGKDRKTTTYRFSYLLVALPFGVMPELRIRREGMFDKLAGAFGFEDINFESEEFSRAFHVKSADRKFAYDVCHPQMIEFLLATRPPTIEVEQVHCCLSDGSGKWSPEQFMQNLGWMDEFFKRWPDYLKADLAQKSGMFQKR